MEELLNLWKKLCLRKKQTPVCLITTSADGTPHVYTQHDAETMKKVYKHLLDSGPQQQIVHINNQQN